MQAFFSRMYIPDFGVPMNEKQILDAFNRAYEMAPETMRLLAINKIPAQELLDHSDFPVQRMPMSTLFCADGLSAANMILGMMFNKYIVLEFDETADAEGVHRIKGFKYLDLIEPETDTYGNTIAFPGLQRRFSVEYKGNNTFDCKLSNPSDEERDYIWQIVRAYSNTQDIDTVKFDCDLSVGINSITLYGVLIYAPCIIEQQTESLPLNVLTLAIQYDRAEHSFMQKFFEL